MEVKPKLEIVPTLNNVATLTEEQNAERQYRLNELLATAPENYTPEVVRELFILLADDPIERKRRMDAYRHRIRTAIYNPELREHIGLRNGKYIVASYDLSRVLGVRHVNILRSLDVYARRTNSFNSAESSTVFDEGFYDVRKRSVRCVFVHLDALDEYCAWWIAQHKDEDAAERFRQWMGLIKASRENIGRFNALLDTIESCYLRASEASKGLTTRFAIHSPEEDRTILKRVVKSTVHPSSVIVNNLQAAILKGNAMAKNAQNKLTKHFPECQTFMDCGSILELQEVEFNNINAMGGMEAADKRASEYLSKYDKNNEWAKNL